MDDKIREERGRAREAEELIAELERQMGAEDEETEVHKRQVRSAWRHVGSTQSANCTKLKFLSPPMCEHSGEG